MTRELSSISLLFGLLAVSLLGMTGCEAPAGPAPQSFAPPRANPVMAERPAEYSYKHELRPDASKAARLDQLRREYVVAVARVGDSGSVDSPFGDRRAAVGVGEVNVTASAVGGETAKVVVGVDDSLRTETVRPEPTPAGFTRRARRQIVSELQAAGCFTVLERESINDIIRELEFGQSRWAAKDEESAVGELAQVRYILKGGLEIDSGAVLDAMAPPTPDDWVGSGAFPESSSSRGPFVFRLRMYSVRTGVIVAVADGHGQDSREAITNAVTALKGLVTRNHRASAVEPGR